MDRPLPMPLAATHPRRMQDDEQLSDNAAPATDPEEELTATADAWREPLRGTDVEESADEVARGAENARRQPGYGREGQ